MIDVTVVLLDEGLPTTSMAPIEIPAACSSGIGPQACRDRFGVRRHAA